MCITTGSTCREPSMLAVSKASITQIEHAGRQHGGSNRAGVVNAPCSAPHRGRSPPRHPRLPSGFLEPAHTHAHTHPVRSLPVRASYLFHTGHPFRCLHHPSQQGPAMSGDRAARWRASRKRGMVPRFLHAATLSAGAPTCGSIVNHHRMRSVGSCGGRGFADLLNLRVHKGGDAARQRGVTAASQLAPCLPLSQTRQTHIHARADTRIWSQRRKHFLETNMDRQTNA